eukprot:CAMPEP_0116922558 /NCGR_PEP_ID=MMETSP0467-20121206/22336_1 /TAXON_ID=283647 /ORGANISM="Mesodinium pulex, Strain SPMC105" /LENGTH=66 /DNA_ID=CAMNT_0004600917 /DNA_START=674 /DNA_END=874 /DNA_ORIENTATION=+
MANDSMKSMTSLVIFCENGAMSFTGGITTPIEGCSRYAGSVSFGAEGVTGVDDEVDEGLITSTSEL